MYLNEKSQFKVMTFLKAEKRLTLSDQGYLAICDVTYENDFQNKSGRYIEK